MSVMEGGKVAKIQFCEAHNDTWTTNAVAIGTTAPAVANLVTLTTTARDAFTAQQVARDAAKDATNNLNIAVRAMTNAAAEIIKQIKAKAAVSGDSIYSLASIPVPAIPGPVGELGKPNTFKATLSETGTVELNWKCRQPKSATGTVYTVYRRIGGTGEYQYLGGSGMKKFWDNTLPAGSTEVQYQVQAVRSTSVGPFAQFNVNFGVNVAPTVTEVAPAKLAA